MCQYFYWPLTQFQSLFRCLSQIRMSVYDNGYVPTETWRHNELQPRHFKDDEDSKQCWTLNTQRHGEPAQRLRFYSKSRDYILFKEGIIDHM